MSLFYFVEILNASGDVQTRHKFSQLPIRLGRAYTNDIILDDPHTAAEHAVIEQDESGTLILRNLSSHNGIKIKGKHHTQVALNGDTLARLGHTHIRVRDNHYRVSDEITDITYHGWHGWPLLACALLLITLVAVSEFWLEDITEHKATDYITTVLQWILSAAAWAGMWALANRVFGGATNFGRHLLILSCGLVALDTSHYLYMILSFSFALEWPSLYKSHLPIAIVTIMIYFHLRLINTRKRNLLKWLCLATAMTVAGLKLMNNYQSNNQYADKLYTSETLPPALRISRNHSLEEFEVSIATLKKEIDAEREKAIKEKAEKKRR